MIIVLDALVRAICETHADLEAQTIHASSACYIGTYDDCRLALMVQRADQSPIQGVAVYDAITNAELLADVTLADAYANAARAYRVAVSAHEVAAQRLTDAGRTRAADAQRQAAFRSKMRAIMYERYARDTPGEAISAAAHQDAKRRDECVGHGRGGAGRCCDRAGEYNGYGSDGPTTFTCPTQCSCHD